MQTLCGFSSKAKLSVRNEASCGSLLGLLVCVMAADRLQSNQMFAGDVAWKGLRSAAFVPGWLGCPSDNSEATRLVGMLATPSSLQSPDLPEVQS